MSRAFPIELPTLHEVFGDHSRLMQAFTRARIKSVVPVMLLPREALREFYGIKSATSFEISKRLSAHGLAHHQFCERLSTFIDKQFGCIEDAPVATLEVVTIHDMDQARPVYAPTHLLHLLEDIEPVMTVSDLMRMDEEGIRAMVQRHNPLGPVVERYVDEIDEINWRLKQWSTEFHIKRQADRARHLRVVGE